MTGAAKINFTDSQRKTLEKFWTSKRIDWLEAQCTLAAHAGEKPLEQVGLDRRLTKKRVAKAVEAIETAIDEIKALHDSAGEAADIAAGFGGHTLPLITTARNAAWQLENTLEQMTATRDDQRSSILIRLIAEKLRKDGVDVSAKKGGALVQVCGLALEAIGTVPKDLPATVRQVIKRL